MNTFFSSVPLTGALSLTRYFRPGKPLSPELNARFQKQYQSGGIAPTTFAIILGLLATLALYLVAGLSKADGVGWYEGVQAQRVHRLLFITMFLIGVLWFGKVFSHRWIVVAYAVALVVFSIGPVSILLTADVVRDAVIAWRNTASQMICIVLAFAFLRVSLRFLILTSVLSSVVVVLVLFDSTEQRMIAGNSLVSMLVIGIAIWLTIYWRERRLFEQTVVIEAAAEVERKYADFSRQERRSLIHDIRQPMSAFAIHMGILRTTQALTPELEHKLATLGFAFDALKGQVDEFSRESQNSVETQTVALSLERVNIIKVVSNTVQLHEPLAATKSIALTAIYRPTDTSYMARTNFIQLSNVLQLLVGNAIKFNDGATVRVSCKLTSKDCSIHVTDTGPGIESANLDKIFDAGFSTGPADTNSQGLGLFNVRKIVKNLPEHRIRVRSKPGHYTSFKLTLPLAMSHSQALKNVRLLIVDDEPTITSGLSTLLEGYGATVVTAGSATQAVNLVIADDLAFEILICDHDLGTGANGMALIRQIREYYDTEIPAILVTGRRTQIGPIANLVEVVSKPFDADALLRVIERYVVKL